MASVTTEPVCGGASVTRGTVAPMTATSGLMTNLACLYVVHAFNYLVPFVTVPYLARILGMEDWGRYSFAESCARYASLFIEYGFSLWAVREVARCRDDSLACSRLLGGVLGVQVTTSVLILPASVWAWHSSRFQHSSALIAAAACWAVLEGMGIMWYFQGRERIRTIAWVDILSKSSAIGAIFLCVHGPSDVWKVLALRAAAAGVTLSAGLLLAYREIPWQSPDWKLIQQMYLDAASMFSYRSANALSTLANVIVLGIVARPEIVGFYAGAEKISKAATALLQPITQVIYPHMAHIAHNRPYEARRVAAIALALMTGGGLLLGVVVFTSAPLIVSVFLGPGYEPAVLVLRVLAMLHPLMAINNMLGIQWMLPLNMDRIFNRIVLACGLLNVVLAAVLPRWWAQVGPAWAVVTAQALAMICIVVVLSRRRLLPFSKRIRETEVVHGVC